MIAYWVSVVGLILLGFAIRQGMQTWAERRELQLRHENSVLRAHVAQLRGMVAKSEGEPPVLDLALMEEQLQNYGCTRMKRINKKQ